MKKERLRRIRTIILEQLALFSLELILVLFFGLVAFLIFVKISGLLINNEITAFDERLYFWVRYYSSGFLDFIMLGATALGNRQFIVFPAIGILIYFLLIKPHRWYSIKIPVVALGSISANLLLKNIFDRPRPVLEQMVDVSGFSFPSGHAMFSLSFYGLLIYIVWRHVANKTIRFLITGVLTLLIFLIGISRIYLGVHYASDVFAGFAAGFIWLVVSLLIIDFVEKHIKKRARKRLNAS